MSHRVAFPIMGTMASVVIPDHAGGNAEAAVRACQARLAADEQCFSHYRPDSDIERWMRGEPIGREAQEDIAAVLDACRQLEIQSEGHFRARDPHTDRMDTAGYVKGFAIGRAADAMRACGVHDFSLNVGGDNACAGEAEPNRPWRVAIADPFRPRSLAAILDVRDAAVATSGEQQRAGHIWFVFPQPVTPAVASFTVVGPDIAMADAYATIGYAMAGSGAIASAMAWVAEHPGYRSLVIASDGRVLADAPELLQPIAATSSND